MVAPITLTEAQAFVARHHRHNRPPLGGLFAVSVRDGDTIHGVAIAGRPVARGLQDGLTVEITRTCTDGARNANSMLYGAICRAAKALGYRRAITYTLTEEPGASLRAAGFNEDARLKARATWACSARHRVQDDLFGNEMRPAGPKVRWVRNLGNGAPVAAPAVAPNKLPPERGEEG